MADPSSRFVNPAAKSQRRPNCVLVRRVIFAVALRPPLPRHVLSIDPPPPPSACFPQVCFFGDGSYGWFPPQDLIAFGPNYESRRNQASRNKVRAAWLPPWRRSPPSWPVSSERGIRGGGASAACLHISQNATGFRPTVVVCLKTFQRDM